MVFKISYFYNIRHLKPNQVPVSTAMFDPKWFHNNKGSNHIFVDKNGVVNGVRAGVLAPDSTCNNLCSGKEKCYTHPSICAFLKAYRAQLSRLDFVEVTNKIAEGVKNIAQRNPMYNGEEIECILIVYETPSNLCSEREPLRKWFLSHGCMLEEFRHE